MTPKQRRLLRLLLPFGLAALLLLLAAAWIVLRPARLTLPRLARLGKFFEDAAARTDWRIPAGARCEGAPFQFPTEGYVGFYWGDSFRPPLRHTGLDIFGGLEPGQTPVYAAYPGYLTRLPDWKSTVIIRVPSDPLQPGRQIWTYYTHMADLQGVSFIDPAFPPGTSEVLVEAGTLLGRMGNFSGAPGTPTGVHLHFSVVLDDGSGKFRDERVLANTLDPSPYFARPLNFTQHPDPIPFCR
jgi:murein DD-endopeptidase MepM/ murein hydrolase activator NlpD